MKAHISCGLPNIQYNRIAARGQIAIPIATRGPASGAQGGPGLLDQGLDIVQPEFRRGEAMNHQVDSGVLIREVRGAEQDNRKGRVGSRPWRPRRGEKLRYLR